MIADEDQDALQAEFRVGHQVGEQRAAVHAEVEEHLRDRHLDEGREVHEDAEGDAGQVGRASVFAPASASIHSGRMRTRITPTTNTPTTSSGKICLTKRHDSHSQSRSSSSPMRRAGEPDAAPARRGQHAEELAGEADAQAGRRRLDAQARRPAASRAISARATPRPAVEAVVDALEAAPRGEPDRRPAARSAPRPGPRRPPRPLRHRTERARRAAPAGRRRRRAAGAGWHRRRSGSRASACRRAAAPPRRSRKASAARLMPRSACAANSASVARSCAASSARNSSAMISPMPMPNASDRNKRAKARSAPMTPPV